MRNGTAQLWPRLSGIIDIIFKMILALLLLLAPVSFYGSLVIISPPLPVNESLYSTAEFHCICHHCSGQYWAVDGVSANLAVSYDKGIRRFGPTIFTNGSKLYTLTMPASVELNGSIIECFAYNGSTVNSSTELLVQGLLSEVIDSTVTQINSATLLLHYTAPFTLIGVPILHYNILISPANISVNVTDTQYNIHINDYCIGYDVSITPWNIVGMGNTTILSDIILYQAPIVTMLPQLIQEYKTNNEELQVYINFKYNTSCKGNMPRLALLKINEEKEEHYFTWESDDDNVNVTINITSFLEYGAAYNISMSLITANNTGTNDFTFNISTYHVINAIILSVNDTTVCLECSFKQNSPSTGCYAALHAINATGEGVPVLYYKILKSLHDTIAIDCISTIPNGVYSITILDALSYDKGLLNNTAINISSLITIHRMPLVAPTTLTSDIQASTSSTFMSTSGSQVLIVTLSCTGIIAIIVITILVIIIVGMYITMRRKKNKRDGDITSQVIRGDNIMFNEAYDKTRPEGLQVNVAYETIRANAAYNVPNIVPLNERIYDTIPDIK